jgi:GlpG protein
LNWIAVKYFSLDHDLSALSRYLQERGLEHRITEENAQQCLAVTDAAVIPALQDFLQQLEDGRAQLPSATAEPLVTPPYIQAGAAQPSLLVQALHTPIVLALILLSAVGGLLVTTEAGNLFLHYFSFQDFTDTQYIPIGESLSGGEFWRLLTPIFLHFGIFHFLFNSLWMWDLGRRLEILQGKWGFLLFVVVTGIASNLTQYMWSGSSNFGGMSGVVYALVGFIAVRQRLNPHPLVAVSPALIGFMLVWLVLCMTGVVDYFIAGSVANAAHLGGLVAGAVYALFTGRYFLR